MDRRRSKSKSKAKAFLKKAEEIASREAVATVLPPPGLRCPICTKRKTDVLAWRPHSMKGELIVCTACQRRSAAAIDTYVYIFLEGRMVRAILKSTRAIGNFQTEYSVVTDHGLSVRTTFVAADVSMGMKALGRELLRHEREKTGRGSDSNDGTACNYSD